MSIAVLMGLTVSLTLLVRQNRIEQQKLRQELQQLKIAKEARDLKRSQAVVEASQPPIVEQVAEVPTPAPVVAYTAPTPVDHVALMTQAGIAPADFPAVEYIISRESGWNPNATNASSGAHGLPQALPYSKTGCGWTDALCQLQWANQYAVSRYGGWWNAQAFWARSQWW